MAFESTAINDFIAGLQQKPLQDQREPNDWLFGTPERDDATEIDPRQLHDDKATTPFDKATPPVVPLPQAFRRMPAPAIDAVMHRSPSPTRHVRVTDWGNVAKKLALPIGVFSIAIVVMGVYAAKTDSTPARKADQVAAAAIVPAKAAPAPAPLVAPKPAPAPEAKPVVTPIEEPKPVVTPIAEAIATPVAAPAAPAKTEPAATPAVAPAPADTTTIEPGSPASRFVAANEPTVPTVPTAKAKPAPAPTAVAGLVPSPKAAAPTPPPLATPVVAKKRAPAKRAAKTPVAVKHHTAAKKAVAAADDEENPVAAKPAGKGILQLSSSPAMNVWVDGRNSGAETPVKIRLLAGKHKVTLFDNGKARSFDVEIKPDTTTKITKNYE